MVNIINDNNVDFNEIAQNIKKGVYNRLGVGSGRIVFDLGNGLVVKAAKNMRGIAQNKAEYKISLNDSSDVFAKIPYVSEEFKYLLMEKADKVENISYIRDYYQVRNNHELFKKLRLYDVASKSGLILNDLTRKANWGQIDGKPIIVDYGYTNSVQRKYYMPTALRLMRR